MDALSPDSPEILRIVEMINRRQWHRKFSGSMEHLGFPPGTAARYMNHVDEKIERATDELG